MDNADIAQIEQERLLTRQLAKLNLPPQSTQNQNADGDYECIDCGELVEPQRVKLGLISRCIGCQQTFEKMR